jgi:two-component system, NarL family, response regulator NreC
MEQQSLAHWWPSTQMPGRLYRRAGTVSSRAALSCAGIREKVPGTQIVVLTMQNDPAFAREALRAGAMGYVLKQAGRHRAGAGGPPGRGGPDLSEPGAGRAPRGGAPRALRAAGRPQRTRARGPQADALGHTTGEIAQALYLSVRTVESHRAHIQQKTGRTSCADLVAYARDHELT